MDTQLYSEYYYVIIVIGGEVLKSALLSLNFTVAYVKVKTTMLYKGYQLDRFQEEAINSIEDGHSVIVAAPTGAGKTLIAEYAVEKCVKEKKRIIYTAPIKALSNQKYRDFSKEYGELVGILTGDVVINQHAPILLMTTEVFRNTIFDNASRLDDVDYVIFDEIHYINDIQRGTVWEESIIFAPQNIKFICLSATIPNLKQFSQWIQSVRDISIDTVEEKKRPVPLIHQMYISGYGLQDLDFLRELQRRNDRFASKNRTDLVRIIEEKKQLPCLYFCFSRDGCKSNAIEYSKHNFLSKAEKSKILNDFDLLCDKYKITDEPKIKFFRRLIGNGVAYHHAGMLPTLKEVVEQLFTSGLIKLLFTTETFAVGINMPAQTVVFESMEKYDGVSFRYLKTLEYHQMAGRAGRRGIDPVGYVYAQVDPRFSEPDEVERIVFGKVEELESQFNLSYSTLLNLYEQFGKNIYQVCTSSFNNYQAYEIAEEIDKKIKSLEKKQERLSEIECIREDVDEPTKKIGEYVDFMSFMESERNKLRDKESKIRKQHRGRKNRVRRNKLSAIDEYLKMLSIQKKDLFCADCDVLETCVRKYRRIKSTREQIEKNEQYKENVLNYQREQMSYRLKVLEQIGYIENEQVLPRGKFASQIYGYEIQATQLMFAGYFDSLDEQSINVLVMAIVHESKKGDKYSKLKDKSLRKILRQADKELDIVRGYEKIHNVDEFTPPLEPGLSNAIIAWSNGCEFNELSKYASLADGDFVRSFRSTIDLLRQIRRASGANKGLRGKLSRCIEMLHRDVVDAERQLRVNI